MMSLEELTKKRESIKQEIDTAEAKLKEIAGLKGLKMQELSCVEGDIAKLSQAERKQSALEDELADLTKKRDELEQQVNSNPTIQEFYAVCARIEEIKDELSKLDGAKQ